MCWTPLFASKNKLRKKDMSLPTNNWNYIIKYINYNIQGRNHIRISVLMDE